MIESNIPSSDTLISAEQRSIKLRKVLDDIKSICIDNINSPTNVLSQSLSGYLDFDEAGKTNLTEIGLIKFIDYINSAMRKFDLTSDEARELYDAISLSAKTCFENGYEKHSEEDKINELFYWAKIGV